MLTLSTRIIDDDGNVIYTHKGLMEYLIKYKQFPSELLYMDNEVEQFNKYANMFDIPTIKLPKNLINHEKRKNNWFYPAEYNEIDLEVYFISLCKTPDEKERVLLELKEYKRTNMEKLLRFAIFLKDFMNKEGIFNGVGRGSSVCSFCLYLIGLTYINPIKYDLDIKDFLKD